MLSMLEKLIGLRQRVARLNSARYQQVTPLRDWQIVDHLPDESPCPEADDPRWRAITIGEAWGAAGAYAWLRAPLPDTVTESAANMVLLLRLFDYTRPPADELRLNTQMRPEALVYAAGVPVQAVNRGHHEVALAGARGGMLTVAAACGYSPEQRYFQQAELALLDPAVNALYWDAFVILGLGDGTLEPNEAQRLLEALYQALNLIDWRDPAHLNGVEAARDHLRAAAFVEHPATAPVIHAVGHAHIDLGWLWPLSFSRGKGIRTAHSQLYFMERFARYTFLQTQPQLYQAIQQDAPDLFARIRQRIDDGRWNATGATWVEPDMNLISGESMARQFLHGMRYFRDDLGVRPRVLWLPDTFGFNAQIPQIMQASAIPYFFTSKMSWNATNKLPNDTFRWRGLDGTEVLAHMATTHRQGQSVTCYEGALLPYEAADTWQSYKNKALNLHTLVAYGYGDGGGGPDVDILERLQRYHDGIDGMASLHASTAEDFFEALERDLQGELPVWSGELYFELHRGCYTSQARTKWFNRTLESRLHDAEWLCTTAHYHGLQPYPREHLRAVWDVLLTNQFHDILPGSSIRATYVQAEAEYTAALASVDAVISTALEALFNERAQGEEGWTVVNTLSWARDVVLTLPLHGAAGIIDQTGTPCRWQSLDDGQALVEVKAVPALGTVYVQAAASAPTAASPSLLSVSASHLENTALRVEFDDSGQIVRIYDKIHERDVLPAGTVANQFQLFQDAPARWQAWEIDPDYVAQPLPNPTLRALRVIETGPVRATIEVEYTFGASALRQRISLTADSPLLRFDTTVDWHERHTLLKVAFPLDVNAARATYEIPFGAVERPTHRNTSWDSARFEVPALRWADLSEADYGVALINDSKYGYDTLDNVLRLSLLRAPTMPDPEADQGVHHFAYGLLPHGGDWRQGVVAAAAAFNHPAHVVSGVSSPAWANRPLVTCRHNGSAVVDTVKAAEDGAGVVVRVYEAHGNRQEVILTLDNAISRVEEVNILEEPCADTHLTFAAGELKFGLRPYQVRSFRLRR